MIEVKNLSKRYGDHLAVDHLSFCVEDGQIYGFLGPNGAGKSTTMNILTGYLAPTEGQVLVNGKDIVKEPEEAKKSIGYLPELPPVYADMTVMEYFQFVAELKKVPKKDRKEQLEEIMSMVGISDVRNRLIKNLSKGYKQRVGLAQAIVGYPEVIILDEPTVGLDPKQIIEIRELIQKLSKDHTIILSSHILSEISAVCNHIMIISKGKLVASSSTDDLLEQMQGEAQLKLVVKASKEDAESVLEKVTNIDNASVTPAEEMTEIVLSVKGNTDIREAVFFAFADARLPILQMQYERRSLEEIFLELTQTGEEPAQETAEVPAEVAAEEPAEAPQPEEKEETENAGDL